MGLKDKLKKTGKGLEKVVSKSVDVVTRPVRGTYKWMKTYKSDIENGFFIGADFYNFMRDLDPVDTVDDIFHGKSSDPEHHGDLRYSIGVERADVYTDKLDTLSDKEQTKVTTATWAVGLPLGVISYPIVYPLWIRRVNKKRAKEQQKDAQVGTIDEKISQ